MRARALPSVAVRVAVTITAMLLPLAATAPAAAGGPTSVLLSAPALGRTASLYTGSTGYVALSDHVGAFTTPGPGAEDRGSPREHAVGEAVSLTWLVHDVTVWRVDRVYVDAPGGPWIASQVSMGENVWDAPVVWHRAIQPKALVELLGSLGLLAGKSPSAPDVGTDLAPAQPQGPTDGAADVRLERAVAGGTAAPDGHGTPMLVTVGLVGLAAGGAITCLAMVTTRRRAVARAWARGDELALGTDVLDSELTRIVR